MKKMLLGMLASLLVISTSASAKDISAYLVGKYVGIDTAKNRLARAGFEVVAEYTSVKDGTTVVFTNDALKAEATKENRGHMAVLRLFIDDAEKKISITNPLYFGRAFMQDDYNADVFEAQLASINKVFKGLTGSADKLDEDDLAGYHFMMGMPYYEDKDELGEGTTSDLLAKVKSYKDGKNIIFVLQLSDDSYLVGYDLGKRTKKFVKKIGRANAAVLPYCITIENGVASSLEAKFYLAVSYPLLSMGEFTTIATVPGAITKDLSKPFK